MHSMRLDPSERPSKNFAQIMQVQFSSRLGSNEQKIDAFATVDIFSLNFKRCKGLLGILIGIDRPLAVIRLINLVEMRGL